MLFDLGTPWQSFVLNGLGPTLIWSVILSLIHSTNTYGAYLLKGDGNCINEHVRLIWKVTNASEGSRGKGIMSAKTCRGRFLLFDRFPLPKEPSLFYPHAFFTGHFLGLISLFCPLLRKPIIRFQDSTEITHAL